MNRRALLGALERIVDPQTGTLQKAKSKYAQYPSEVSEALILHDASEVLRQVLEREPDLVSWMIRQGNAAINLNMMLERKLIRRAMQGGPEDAVQWLERIRPLERANVIETVPMWGPEISRPIALFDNISLVPFASLPDSSHRRRLEAAELGGIWSAPPFAWSAPTLALVANWTVEPLFYRSQDEDGLKLVGDGVLLNDVRLCLTVVGPSTIVPAIRWYDFEDADLQQTMMGMSYQLGGAEIQPQFLRSFGVFDPERARFLTEKFVKNKGPDRQRVKLALDRFDRAMRRQNPGDMALEIAIALEALLGDGSSELTSKVSLRSAKLAGGEKADRLELRAIIQAIYSLRSTVAHTGHTPADVKTRGLGKMKVDDLISRGAIAAARVIAAAIERGSLPDWFEAEIAP